MSGKSFFLDAGGMDAGVIATQKYELWQPGMESGGGSGYQPVRWAKPAIG